MVSDRCDIHDIALVPVDGDDDCLACVSDARFTIADYPRPEVGWTPPPLVTSTELLRRAAYWRRARGDDDDA